MGFQFVKKEKQPQKEKLKKEKKVPVKKIGTHKKSVMLLWGIFIFAFIFAVYKNFTAVDVRTIEKETIVEYKQQNMSRIDTFVKDFVWNYYTWDAGNVPDWRERIKNYFPEVLQKLNETTVADEIPASSAAHNTKVWDIAQVNDNEYDVTFSVSQYMTEIQTVQKEVEGKPGEVEEVLEPVNWYSYAAYYTRVYVDEQGDMTITRNPSITTTPGKSEYEPKKQESDGTVKVQTANEINKFLETFFALYPSADEDTLTYYISDNAMQPIYKDYVFSELQEQVYQTIDEENVKVFVIVKYLNQETRSIQYAQYELQLQKSHNWVIVDCK